MRDFVYTDPKDFISIDPGVHTSGIAYWSDGVLVWVDYKKPSFDQCVPLVIEKPQVYQGRAQKGDPNDLITLAVEVGRISSLYPSVDFVLPRQWKGTIKKEMMLKRILKTMTDDELLLLKNLKLPKSKEHNVVDAVGIGLWRLGRL
jgi:hypothetical protein